MADLIVTSEVVEDSAKQLKAVLDELDDMKEMWDGGDIWGHKTLEGAMNDFVKKWWVKREKLKENLKDLQGKMEQAAETWSETEDSLEQSLQSDGK